jgi:4-amino-4-deoxy-L-arabinose transferase-like glycosyltransferase
MKDVNKVDDLKLFLTFFIIYSIFVHWVGWNEESRLLLAISIVDSNSFDINKYKDFTGDRLLINGNYYSDKPPGISFFLSPIYYIFRNLINEQFGENKNNYYLVPQPQFNTTVYLIGTGIEKSVVLTIIFGVIFLSSLTGALSVVIFKRLLLIFFDRKTSLTISLIFGFSTLILVYSTVLMGDSFSVFLIVLSFYILQKNIKNRYFISGIILGISCIINYLSILSAVLILVFIWKKSKSIEKIIFIISFIIALIPLFIYNFFISGNLFISSYNFVDPKISPCVFGKKYLEYCPEIGTLSFYYKILIEEINPLRILIFPYRGLLFYTPILTLFFISIYFSYKKNSQITKFSILTFLTYLFANSIYPYWFGGSAFGSRYLINAIPFILIPIGYFYKEMKFKFTRFVFFTLAFLSTFHIILSTSVYWEGALIFYTKDGPIIYNEWYTGKIIDNFGSIRWHNPLYNHYLPAFLDNGPRSRLLEQALVLNIPDVRDFQEIPRKELKLLTLPNFGILTLKVPFLVIPIILSIFTIIWYKEIKKHKKLLYFLIGIILILFISRLSLSKVVYSEGFYPQSMKEKNMWFGNESKIYIFSPKDKQVIIDIKLVNYFMEREKSLNVSLNNKTIYTQSITANNLIIPAFLKNGENILTLKTNTCTIPLLVENSSKDYRCLSFGIKDVEVIDVESLNGSRVFYSNFYEKSPYEDLIWASKEGKIIVYLNESKKVLVHLNVKSFLRDRVVEINGIKYDVFKEGTNIYHVMEGNKGINLINFVEINGSCDVVKYILKNDDSKCLSFGIKDVEVIDVESLNGSRVFYSNFYEKSPYEDLIWASKEGKIIVYLNESKKVLVHLNVKSFLRDRVVEINGIKYDVFKEGTNIYHVMEGNKGINLINFVEINGSCDVVKYILKNDDSRCLSFGIKDVEVIDVESLNGSRVFYSNFYEKSPYEDLIWIKNYGYIIFYTYQELNNVKIYFNFFPYMKARSLNFYLNDIHLNKFDISKNGGVVDTKFLNIHKGVNILRLVSLDECTIVDDIIHNGDKRCLSIGLRYIEVK